MYVYQFISSGLNMDTLRTHTQILMIHILPQFAAHIITCGDHMPE